MTKSKLLEKIIETTNGVVYLKIVFVDIAKFSKRRTIAQISILNNFTNLTKEAINRVEIQNLEIIKRNNYNFATDIIKIPTGDGILLAMPFEGLVRPHFDFSIELLKLIFESNKKYEPCSKFDSKGWCDCHNYFDVRVGIDEGKALVYKDLNGNYNVAGDLINNAQRIMSAGSEKTILMGEKAFENLTQFEFGIIDDFTSPKRITDKHGNHIQVHHYCPQNIEYINSKVPNKIIETEGLYQIEKKYNEAIALSQSLISNITTGVTYGESIFGTRIGHFFSEKKLLAKKAIDILIKELENNEKMKFCLLIDSGTTTYHLFTEICDKIKEYTKSNNETNSWINRIFIVTNNLPGVQYLIKNCRKGSDEYSDLLVKCLLLPGIPLPVYAAVVGSEATKFLDSKHIKKCIEKELDVKNNEYKIISLMSANYMVRHPGLIDDRIIFCPAARGGEEGGHFDIKKKFAELSDKIYLISPLTKFSFATCNCLNKINKLKIDEVKSPEDARAFPDEVKYREVKLTTSRLIEKCNFIITNRKTTDHFGKFAQDIYDTLKKSYGENKISIVDYNFENWIPNSRNNPEYDSIAMEMEIPHSNLQHAYYDYKNNGDFFIWDPEWMELDKK